MPANNNANRPARSFPALKGYQALCVMVAGLVMVFTSTGLLVVGVLKQVDIDKWDVLIHALFVGAGLLLLVPRRLLSLLEDLSRFKWFGKKDT